MSHFGRAGPPDIRDTYSLLVLNITFRTTPDDLYPLFDRYGKVVDIFIPRDRRSGESRGFAFVRYKHVEEARKAVERLDGVNVDGRQIAVQFAKYGRNDEKITHGKISSIRRSRSRSPRRTRTRDEYGRDHQEPRNRSRSRERYGRERERSRDQYYPRDRYEDRSRDGYGRDRYERERGRERDLYERDRSRAADERRYMYERERSKDVYDRDRSTERSRDAFERNRSRDALEPQRSRDRHEGERNRERYETERFPEQAGIPRRPSKQSLSPPPAASLSPAREHEGSRGPRSPVHPSIAVGSESKSPERRRLRTPSRNPEEPDNQGGSVVPSNNDLEVQSPYNTDPEDG